MKFYLGETVQLNITRKKVYKGDNRTDRFELINTSQPTLCHHHP